MENTKVGMPDMIEKYTVGTLVYITYRKIECLGIVLFSGEEEPDDFIGLNSEYIGVRQSGGYVVLSCYDKDMLVAVGIKEKYLSFSVGRNSMASPHFNLFYFQLNDFIVDRKTGAEYSIYKGVINDKTNITNRITGAQKGGSLLLKPTDKLGRSRYATTNELLENFDHV